MRVIYVFVGFQDFEPITVLEILFLLVTRIFLETKNIIAYYMGNFLKVF